MIVDHHGGRLLHWVRLAHYHGWLSARAPASTPTSPVESLWVGIEDRWVLLWSKTDARRNHWLCHDWLHRRG